MKTRRSEFIDELFDSSLSNRFSVVKNKVAGNIIILAVKMEEDKLKVYSLSSILESNSDSFEDYISKQGKWRNLENSDIPLSVFDLFIEGIE